jgi:hypothetical protein
MQTPQLALQRNSAAMVLAAMPVADRDALLASAANTYLHDLETSKVHPLTPDKFTEDEKVQLRAHLLDGGGVTDDEYLREIVIQAILDSDWDTMFREMPHVVKNWINLREPLIVATDDGVTINQYAPKPDPAMVPVPNIGGPNVGA